MLDKSQQFEISLCSPTASEFLPYYNSSSFLTLSSILHSGFALERLQTANFEYFPDLYSPNIAPIMQ